MAIRTRCSVWLRNGAGAARDRWSIEALICRMDLSRNKNIRGALAALEVLCRTVEVCLTVVGGNPAEARRAGLRVPGALPVQFIGSDN